MSSPSRIESSIDRPMRSVSLSWRPRTLRARLVVYGTAFLLAAAAIMSYVSVRLSRSEARRYLEGQLVRVADVFGATLDHTGRAGTQDVLAVFSRENRGSPAYSADVVGRDEVIVASTDTTHVGRSAAAVAGRPEPGIDGVISGRLPYSTSEMTHAGRPVLDVTIPLRQNPLNRDEITGALHMAVMSEALWTLERYHIAAYLLSALLLVVLLVVPLWFYVESGILRPLRALTAAQDAPVDRVHASHLIPAEAMPSHELGDAMRSHNEMLLRIEQSEADLRARLKELSTLNSTAAILSETSSIDEVLAQTLRIVLEITRADAAEVSLLDPATQRLSVKASHGFDTGWLREESERPATCLCGEVIAGEAPICVPEIATDPRSVRLACRREGFQSFSAVPLRAAGETLGLLSLHGRVAHNPSLQQMDLLTAIGNQIGVALVNVRLYLETRRLARTDSLTGLANRRVFDERLRDECRRARRYRRSLSVIIADIDHFKEVNDTYGHAAGDAVLRQLATLMRSSVRETDLVGRFGGEEFVVLLPETPQDSAITVAEKIRCCIVRHGFSGVVAGGVIRIAISLGVGTFTGDPSESRDPESLLKRADAALYQAKQTGRNRVCAWRVPGPADEKLPGTSSEWWSAG